VRADAIEAATSARVSVLAQVFRSLRLLGRLGILAVALLAFILALELLKTGAAGVAVVLRGFDGRGMVNTLGFGWLGAYLVMSGSPIAAVSLGLLSSGVLSLTEAFGMLNGSRFGASFIVLFTGFLYYLRGIRGRGVVSVGVLAMVTTATIYVPAMALGAVALAQGWGQAIQPHVPAVFASGVSLFYGPITSFFAQHVPRLVSFFAGLILLLGCFRLFDVVLPSVDSSALEQRWGGWLRSPRKMFLLGVLVTSITLSVSSSLSILVPLAGRGYIRRDQTIPYIMGANISTFADTLVAAMLLRAPLAVTLVLTQMVAVTIVSVLVLALGYGSYQRGLLAVNTWVTGGKLRFAVFVAILALIPAMLLLL
jgi:hypothetical protein